jgi:hypothetical protein
MSMGPDCGRIYRRAAGRVDGAATAARGAAAMIRTDLTGQIHVILMTWRAVLISPLKNRAFPHGGVSRPSALSERIMPAHGA